MENASAIQRGVDSPVDVYANTVMHLAVVQHDHSMVCFLLLKGAHHSPVNQAGVTPLQIAVATRQVDIERVLVRFGAKASTQETTIESPVSAVDDRDSDSRLGLFTDASGDRTAMDITQRDKFQQGIEATWWPATSAAYFGAAIDAVVDSAIDSQLVDQEGCTMLMKASYKGNLDLVNLLIVKKVDVDQMDHHGNTALIWALIAKQYQVAQLLIGSGAKINGIPYANPAAYSQQPLVHMTPLLVACFNGDCEMVKQLLGKGADPNTPVGKGAKTALHIACWTRRKEIVNLLLNNNATVEPDPETWVNWGLVYLKKTTIQQNPWFNVLPEGKARKNSENNNRRLSLQDKVIYCSSEDLVQVTAIVKMLSASAIERQLTAIPKTLAVQPTAQSPRNPSFRQGLNLDVIHIYKGHFGPKLESSAFASSAYQRNRHATRPPLCDCFPVYCTIGHCMQQEHQAALYPHRCKNYPLLGRDGAVHRVR